MLKLLKPKSFLRYAKNMTVAELKNVTDKDVMEYKTEWTSTISPAFEADKGELQGINSKIEQLSIQVYGEQSKQHKYLYRNFAKGESVVDTHYDQYPHPNEIKYWVENSQSGYYEDGCVPAMGYQKKEDN